MDRARAGMKIFVKPWLISRRACRTRPDSHHPPPVTPVWGVRLRDVYGCRMFLQTAHLLPGRPGDAPGGMSDRYALIEHLTGHNQGFGTAAYAQPLVHGGDIGLHRVFSHPHLEGDLLVAQTLGQTRQDAPLRW